MTFHCNWGSCRKPEGAEGGNAPTSKAAGRGGVKGRAGKGLQGARPALLSLPRPCHRHEGSPAEMTVLVPAWNPNVRIPGAMEAWGVEPGQSQKRGVVRDEVEKYGHRFVTAAKE